MTLRNNTKKRKFLFIQVRIIASFKKKNSSICRYYFFLGLEVRNPSSQEQKAELRRPALFE